MRKTLTSLKGATQRQQIALVPASRSQHGKEMWVLSPSWERSSKDLCKVPSQLKIFRWLEDHKHATGTTSRYFPAAHEEGGAKLPPHRDLGQIYL